MTARPEVVAAARSWLGTPFAHQQRVKGQGVDCVGLLIGVGRELGLVAADFDITGYSRIPDGTSFMATAGMHMRRLPKAAMQPGDAIVIRFETDPQHVGILGDYVHGGLSFIHAFATRDRRGKLIEQRLTPAMRQQIVAAFALPGVE